MAHIVLFVSMFVVAFVAAHDSKEASWQEFKLMFNKTYESNELELRSMSIFQANAAKIEENNRLFDEDKRSFKIAINEFTDQDRNDFVKGSRRAGFSAPMLRDLRLRLASHSSRVQILARDTTLQLPAQLDLRRDGYVTAVKNQGQCGSCWAFASTGALEGQYFKKHKRLVRLSEQHLLDCDTSNADCNGGIMTNAFEFVRQNGGIASEDVYPYEAKVGKCRFTNSSHTIMSDYGSIMAPVADEESLKAMVALYGPVAVAIDASPETFRLYSDGIYDDFDQCRNEDEHLNHAVLVVGYGSGPKGKNYWIVKNSWGSSWGQKGYIKMARNADNLCGIASFAVLPMT